MTVQGVGDELARILTEKYGLSVLHNTTHFDMMEGAVSYTHLDVYKRQAEDTTLVTESKDYPVYVMDGEAKTLTRDEIGDLTISVTNTEGEKEDVAIRDVADFTADVGLPSIRRNNQQRTLNVTAVVSDGYNVGLVGEEVQKKLDSYQVPNGYSVALRGENETINESMTEMMKMLALAVAFVYPVSYTHLDVYKRQACIFPPTAL